MYKLIENSFFDFEEPQITIINPDSIGELTKQAADSRIEDFVKHIEPKHGRMYLHINAMGAGEFWSANKNGDYFPEGNLLEHYQTFETSPAHVFRHHINKDPAKSIGKVIYAIYNGRMHRVELIADVDKSLGNDIEERLAKGDYPSTSMACKTPYDVCSICGNKAHSRQEYCNHLRNELGRMYPDGRRVMALNTAPLRFFDISVVIRPADVTSSVLQKVAFAGPVVSSIELAEEEGIGENIKIASHRKLADIIKEVEGTISAAGPELDKILFKTQDPYDDTISDLRVFSLADICHTLADLGISPSIAYLSELIARKYLGDEGRGLGKLVAQYIRAVDPESTEVPNVDLKIGEGKCNPLIRKLMSPSVERASLLPEYVEKRASNIGYASFNPQGIEYVPQPVEKPMEILSPISKALLIIGGTAMLAKMVISHLIDEKLKEKLSDMPRHQNGAKIVVIKQASDYSTASMLAKAATLQEVKSEDRKKDLVQLSKTTRVVLKETNSKLGGKVSNILKTLEMGSKLADKYKD
jgi:hypothetical protein